MTEFATLLHFFIIGSTLILLVLAASYSQGKISSASTKAINIQPAVKEEINRSSFLALALIETPGIIGFIFAIIMLIKHPDNLFGVVAELALFCSLGITGLLVSFASIGPASNSFYAISRQPFMAKKITNLMLLILSLLQTSFIFGFIVSLIIFFKLNFVENIHEALKLIASGLCISLGCIGPILGISNYASHACEGLGKNKDAYPKILSFTFISQALIETPILFSLIISLTLTIVPPKIIITPIDGIIYLLVGLIGGLGNLGAGLGSGRTSSAACDQIALKPELYPVIYKVSILGQSLIDATAIYAFGIAIFLLILNI